MCILCKNPVIIQNPKLPDLLIQCGAYITPDGIKYLRNSTLQLFKYHFPHGQFSKKALSVNHQNIDAFQVVSRSTGEMFPMFLEVSCGHCVICRNKKANIWSFRALCETAVYGSQPYFLTLTYNDENLPREGLCKKDVQDFMKRLRISLDRKGISHNIRYFVCGEYGRKHHRPHYHAIIWNWPNHPIFPHQTAVCKFVEKHWSKGFVYVVPTDHGGVDYVMKYMRKSYKVPENKTPLFFLSSRKNGGIGAEYARRFMDFFRKNPRTTHISVTDPFTGREKSVVLPSYFRDLYFPRVSRAVPKFVRDCYEKFLHCLTSLHSLYTIDRSSSLVPCLPRFVETKRIFEAIEIKGYCTEPIRRIVDNVRRFGQKYLHAEYHKLVCEVDNLCRILNLSSKDIDFDLIENAKHWRAQFMQSLNLEYLNKPQIDVDSLAYDLMQKDMRSLAREIF